MVAGDWKPETRDRKAIAVFAMGYVIVNLIVDILYTMIDPRMRIGNEQS